ncbi:MAG: hypothetical protein EOM02_10365 [Synergistales bacterium]|nr:hypothetical protein [Synergistales bacterium]
MGRIVKAGGGGKVDLSPIEGQLAGLSGKMDRIWEQIKTPGAPPATTVTLLRAFAIATPDPEEG